MIAPTGFLTYSHTYRTLSSSLLFLHAFPVLSTRTDGVTLYGIPRSLIMDACRIITNFAANSCEDYLASDRKGTSPVPAGDMFLSPGTYFYHLAPERVTQYAIVMEFSAFKFPTAIPSHWIRPRTTQEDNHIQLAYSGLPSSETSQRVKTDDASSVVTGYRSRSGASCCHVS